MVVEKKIKKKTCPPPLGLPHPLFYRPKKKTKKKLAAPPFRRRFEKKPKKKPRPPYLKFRKKKPEKLTINFTRP